uniref:Mediator of RNA polymerase II transcription subunit 27 n=1 Tax=Kalanchoe fedtschenkoi TaxID=63787 RepID=A0A7N0U328_KALFE
MQQIQTQTPPPDAAAGAPTKDAPPKQVALAMERLTQAGRLIADIRLGVDRVLEALFVASDPHQTNNKPLHLFVKEDAAVRQHLQDLRAIGCKLEESGVLNESLRSRSNSWGLHMPLVCPDGAVVAYAWKRQLAGQAGASAVDRTRLALKAFTDQKRRFFPHLDDGANGQTSTNEPGAKRHAGSQPSVVSPLEELHDCVSLPNILKRLEKEIPQMKIYTYQRLEWLKKAVSLSSSSSLIENPETSKEHSFRASSTKLIPGSDDAISGAGDVDKIAVIELLVPSVFRALISLHSAGSTDPDTVSFFSPDEGGSYVHPRGVSIFHVFKHVTEQAATAMQFFLSSRSDAALYLLMRWISTYQSLFTKVCSKCGRLLSMDKQSALLLPPVNRPFQQLSFSKISTKQPSSTAKDQNLDSYQAYHIGCLSEEM